MFLTTREAFLKLRYSPILFLRECFSISIFLIIFNKLCSVLNLSVILHSQNIGSLRIMQTYFRLPLGRCNLAISDSRTIGLRSQAIILVSPLYANINLVLCTARMKDMSDNSL